MLDTQIITIDFNTYRIRYQSTKIGDEVVVKSTKPYIYEATIADADDMNWIIIETIQRVWLLILQNIGINSPYRRYQSWTISIK